MKRKTSKGNAKSVKVMNLQTGRRVTITPQTNGIGLRRVKVVPSFIGSNIVRKG